MGKKIMKLAVLAKIETVKGTDPVPTGAANAILVSEPQVTPLEGETATRNNVKPWFGSEGSVQATQYSKLSFSVELAGAGTAGTKPAWEPLMRACGCSVTVSAGVSVTFAPVTNNMESLTLYCNIDGTNHVLTGAQGTVKIATDTKGIPKLQFDFTGLFNPLAAVVLPTPVYTAFKDPVPVNKANTTLSLHTVSLAASSFSWDIGNKVVKRDLMTIDSVEITDRESVGQVVFENHDIGVKDWVGAVLANNKGVLQLIHGKTAGNIIEINAPLAQPQKPTYSDSDGIQMLNVPLVFCTGANGNDEWSIVVR